MINIQGLATEGKLAGEDFPLAEVEPLKRYIAARLTRGELEALRSRHRKLRIDRG